MTPEHVKEAAPPAAESQVRRLRIDAVALRKTVRKGRTSVPLLHDISFSILPGELVAIVGGSGAGKTTLLNALAGMAPPTSGTVLYNGTDFYRHPAQFRSTLGYVPQDDIVHTELTVERTLEYAARLRLAPNTSREECAAAVYETMVALGLTAQADQRVGSLSGGQRKRTSIGVELLTKPGVFFLDEPTSGLDPATDREMMRLLRRLAETGSTVALTTHVPQDIGICDKVVFLARGGYLAFAGTPEQALAYFAVETFDEVYDRLANEATPEHWAQQFRASEHAARATVPEPQSSDIVVDRLQPSPSRPERLSAGFVRQWALLSQRNYEILTRNTLTLAILAGAPLMVILMFAVLFRPDAFRFEDPSPSATLMILFWEAFGAFFFGLTYGLLQICTEFPIFYRERLVNLQIVPYVLSKITVLLPLLAIVMVLMLVVLRMFKRMPDGDLELYSSLTVTLLLAALAALALGLLASAAVSRPEQATLALPMLCFPQVLFSGAILAVPIMADAGRFMSLFMSNRWTFEALGKSVDINDLFARGGSPLGPPLLAQYGGSFSRPIMENWAILAASTLIFLALTCWVLKRKSGAFS